MQVARDFRDSLQDEVSTTDAMLVLIGPDWERLMIERGHEEADFVRIEIEVALALEKPVLPILLGEGTRMPTAENVPESIRAFTFNHGVQLDTGRYFREGMQRLIEDMDEHLFAGMARYRPKPNLGRLGAIAIGIAILGSVGWYLVTSLEDSEQTAEETQVAIENLSESAEQIETSTAQIHRTLIPIQMNQGTRGDRIRQHRLLSNQITKNGTVCIQSRVSFPPEGERFRSKGLTALSSDSDAPNKSLNRERTGRFCQD